MGAGDGHSCGVRTDGTVACWGENAFGEATPPSGTFTEVSAGDGHSCGVRTDGSVACWGQNAEGEATPPTGTFTQVSAGNSHTCGLRTDGTVACWGRNSGGEATPPADTFVQLNAGGRHTCGVRADGTVACWGSDVFGQATPPAGTAAHATGAGGNHTCAIGTDGTVTCWGDDRFGQSTPPAGTFTQVSAGTAHTCGVSTGGTVLCWGLNNNAEVLPSFTNTPPDGAVDEAYSHTFTTTFESPTPTFSHTGGTLPPGLSLGAAGVLFGIPHMTGSFTFAVSFTNGLAPVGSGEFTVVITKPPEATTTVVSSSPDPSTYGQAVTLRAEVSPPFGPTGIVRFTVGATGQFLCVAVLIAGPAECDTESTALAAGTTRSSGRILVAAGSLRARARTSTLSTPRR